MPESPAPAQLEGLLLEGCEWLPGAAGGLLRVRGRWTTPSPPAPPSLWIRAGGHSHRFDSLPDSRFAREPEVWRGTYVVPTALMAEGPDELWLAWADGARVAVPDLASPPPVPPAAEEAGDDGPGGEVIGRAVLAERRARRAESEARKQARLAAEALRAVEALELRGSDLERGLESLCTERDALAARLAGPDFAHLRGAADAAARRAAHSREAFAAAARARGGAREWRVHAHTAALVRAGHPDELAALRARLAASESLRDAEAVARAALDEQLDRERAARVAAEQALEAARGSLGARIAELDRHAAGLAGELELQRRAREQAEAAARIARPEPARAQRLAADLDAAAAALRERVPPPEEPAPDPATSPAATPEAATPPAAAPAAATPDAATPDAAAPDAPARDAATPDVPERAGHRLRGALVRLAREDPVAAGRILAALLPAQAMILKQAADYDLTIREVGTFAITVAGGRAWVKPVKSPRGRRNAEFHVSAGAQALAEILAGAPPRLRRFSGPQRISGRKRRSKPVLSALVNSRIAFDEAVKARVELAPELVMAALAHVIDPAWTRGHTFTVEQRVGGTAWFIVARDAGGVGVTTARPEPAPEATVTLTPDAFRCLLRGEPTPLGERPTVRGDRLAVALLKAWTDRARGA